MDYLWKQETSRKIRKQELLATGQMHMKTATKVHITGHMLGHFKVADILNLMLCKRRSFNISLSSDIFLISTLCVTDVKQKLEYGSVLPQKSSMCPTDASFRWLNSVCWMWSMEDVKKKKKKWEDKISLSSLVCIRQSLLTLSICQLPGSDFPPPKMYMCISRVVSCGCVHVKNKEPLFFIQSLLSLRDTIYVHPNVLDRKPFRFSYRVLYIYTGLPVCCHCGEVLYICVAGYKHCGWELKQVIGCGSGRGAPPFPFCWFLVGQAKKKRGENLWLNNKIPDLSAVMHHSFHSHTAFPIHTKSWSWHEWEMHRAFGGYSFNSNCILQLSHSIHWLIDLVDPMHTTDCLFDALSKISKTVSKKNYLEIRRKNQIVKWSMYV